MRNSIPVSEFPNITSQNYKQTSPKAYDYNCIAWAYGRNDVWFQPGLFWPISQRDCTVPTYMKLFESIGYVRCDDALFESGFLKIALYIKGENTTHAARQLSTGKWTSKLGGDIDIEHDTPEVLNGPLYGEASIFMKKPA